MRGRLTLGVRSVHPSCGAVPFLYTQHTNHQYTCQFGFRMDALLELNHLPGHLARRFQQISVALFQAEMAAAALDITSVQYAALVVVNDRPDVDQATLAGLIGYDRTTIGGVVDRLVQKGLLQRTVSGTDRRAKVLTTTSEGQATISAAETPVASAQVKLLAGLQPKEAADLVRLLEKAVAALNEHSRAPLVDMAQG